MAVCNKNLFHKFVIPILKHKYKSKLNIHVQTTNVNYQNNIYAYKRLHTASQQWAKVAFNLSDIGEGIREVVVKEWFIKVGDKVSQFDNICEVQSDKASVTITSRYDGVITKLYYKIDEIALVGKPLVELDTGKDEDKSMAKSSAPELQSSVKTLLENASKSDNDSGSTSSSSSSSSSSDSDEDITIRVPCVPSVRRLATEHKINLKSVKGTGKDGRILKEDILKYIATKSTTDQMKIGQFSTDLLANKTEPIRGFKKAMVKTMTESLKIPHFVYSDEISVLKLNQLRQDIKSTLAKQDMKLTLMPFFIKAFSNSLLRYPIVNSVVDENCENITYIKNHNIGVAMDTVNGLAVPIIKNVEALSVVDIANELSKLLAAGREGTFAPSMLSGGTFTVSNIGSIGGTYTKPVILPPQVAIVAIGAVKVLPRFDTSNNVVSDSIVSVSAAGDHRIIDGATMAKFINAFKNQIENPNLLFLNL